MKKIISICISISLTLIFMIDIGTAQKQGSDEFRTQVVEMGNYSLVKQKLDKQMMKKYTSPDLRIIRNTIFAKYGYMFKSTDLQKHFARFKWYRPNESITQQVKKGRVLSKTDLYNIYMLKGLENKNKRSMNRNKSSFDKLPVSIYYMNPCSQLKLGYGWSLTFKKNGEVDFNNGTLEAVSIKGNWEMLKGSISLTYVRSVYSYKNQEETTFHDKPDSIKRYGPYALKKVNSSFIEFFDGSKCNKGN